LHLYQYVDPNGAFDYEKYRTIQERGNLRKIDQVWADEGVIESLAGFALANLDRVTFGLCHGTRRGLEQAWFSQYTGAYFLGTEISNSACDFPNTIKWDFHEVNEGWLGNVDVIYSNSWDHSYDPKRCFTNWMLCLRPGGFCFLEHDVTHTEDYTSRLDPFGISLPELLLLLTDLGQGSFFVRTILSEFPLSKKRRRSLNVIVVEKARQVLKLRTDDHIVSQPKITGMNNAAVVGGTRNKVTVPPEVLRVPGMTTRFERDCVYRAARELKPIGQLVDLGCWLGALTAAMASGVRDNLRLSDDPPRIYAYDTFVSQERMPPQFEQVGVAPVAPGDSFLPHFEQAMAPWRKQIEIRVGDVATVGWIGQPIALLSLDVLKSLKTANAVIRQFFPTLIPGQSLVFQQDFGAYYSTWIHLFHWRARDYFTVAEDVLRSSGVLFKYEKLIPPEQYDAILDLDHATDAEWSSAFEFSRSLVAEDKWEKIFAAEIMRLLHEHRFVEARALASDYEIQGVLGHQFEKMKSSPLWKQALQTQ
jgi:hypothetical protein